MALAVFLRRPVASANFVTIAVLCFAVMFVPCQVDDTSPYCATLRRLRYPRFRVCFGFVTFSFIIIVLCGPSSLPSFGSFVSSLAHQLDTEMLILFLLCMFQPSSFYFLVLSSAWVVLLLVHKLDIS